MKSNKIKWKKIEGHNNEVLQGDNFYISYNPSTGTELMAGTFTSVANSLGSILGKSFKDGEETALKDSSGQWYILQGDYRKEYEKVFSKGEKACISVFRKYEKVARSEWSTA